MASEPYEQIIFRKVKKDILEAIEAIKEVNAEAGEYLEQHIEFDEEKCSFMYTGDDRISINFPDGPTGPPELATKKKLWPPSWSRLGQWVPDTIEILKEEYSEGFLIHVGDQGETWSRELYGQAGLNPQNQYQLFALINGLDQAYHSLINSRNLKQLTDHLSLSDAEVEEYLLNLKGSAAGLIFPLLWHLPQAVRDDIRSAGEILDVPDFGRVDWSQLRDPIRNLASIAQFDPFTEEIELERAVKNSSDADSDAPSGFHELTAFGCCVMSLMLGNWALGSAEEDELPLNTRAATEYATTMTSLRYASLAPEEVVTALFI